MLNEIDHEALGDAFRAAAEAEFHFLIEDLGFQLEGMKPRWLQYCRASVSVNIYHDSNFGLQVEFGRRSDSLGELGGRSWISRVFSRDRGVRPPADKGPEIPPFGLTEVLIAQSRKAPLPADIQELVDTYKRTPDTYFRWFPAETPGQVRTTLHRMAELTREYAPPLLRGDPEAFHALDVDRLKRTELWNRSRWLNELPADLAEECRHLPTAELEHRRNEYLKSRILATRGESVADIRELPADEFLKIYWSRQVKR